MTTVLKYMELNNYSKTTIDGYKYYERLLPPPEHITQEIVDSFCIAHNHHVAKSFLILYKKVHGCNIDIPLSRKQSRSHIMNDLGGYMTMEQIERLLKCAKNKRDFTLFLLMFRCGRRISEVLPLKVSDINFDDGVILFYILKKRREYKRYKAVDSEVITILKSYINEQELLPEDYLFKSRWCKEPISRQRAHQIIREMAKAASIHQIGAHKPHTHHLRHSHAINFLKNVDSSYALKILQQQLEHSDIKATSIYLQFSQKDQKEMLEKAFVKK